ncbi:hypothetical protein FF2_041422 [Malus domestica]
MGIKGVALSEVWSNYNLVASLIITSSSLGSTKKPGEGFQATVDSMGVLIQTTALIYIFPSSLSFSVSTRVCNEIGGNNPKREWCLK